MTNQHTGRATPAPPVGGVWAHAVPVKTERGREELRQRRGELRPRLRTLLVLVDGHRSGAELLQMAAQLGVSYGDLDALLAGQFIELPQPEPAPADFESSAPGALAVAPEPVVAVPVVAVPAAATPVVATPVVAAPAPGVGRVVQAPARPAPVAPAPRAPSVTPPVLRSEVVHVVAPAAMAPAAAPAPDTVAALDAARAALLEWLALDGGRLRHRGLRQRVEQATQAPVLVALLEQAESEIPPNVRSHAGERCVARLRDLLGLGNTHVAEELFVDTQGHVGEWATTQPGG